MLEFVGDGIAGLDVEYRNGIDVMTTETTCLSSIWETDGKVEAYLAEHGRRADFKKMSPAPVAYYQGVIEIDLGAIRPMIALPFHPSNAYAIEEVKANARDIFRAVQEEAERLYGDKTGFNMLDKIRADGIHVDQGVVAGCAGGTYANICALAQLHNQ